MGRRALALQLSATMVFHLRDWLRRLAPTSPAAAHAPLVSCIMPTCNRRPFVARAISYFRRQDYPSKELIVVDDGDDKVRDLVGACRDIRYIELNSRTSIGEKRNIAITESGGDIVAHWDDDDWYDEMRLTYQVTPLLSHLADMTAINMSFLFDILTDSVWFVDRELHRTMFVGGIHTGSLVYWKGIWRESGQFPPINLGDDVIFIRNTVGQGAKLLRLPNDALFARLGPIDGDGELAYLEEVVRRCGGVLYPPKRPVCLYVRHATNTWRFACGEDLGPQAWHKIAPSALLPPEDVAYYRTVAAASMVSHNGGPGAPVSPGSGGDLSIAPGGIPRVPGAL